MAQGQSLFQRISLTLIHFYQVVISLLLGPFRFHLNCSEYPRQAIVEHGTRRGILLSFRKMIKCKPLCTGGLELVPQKTIGSKILC